MKLRCVLNDNYCSLTPLVTNTKIMPKRTVYSISPSLSTYICKYK